jgi:acetyltransferase (GNAT) family protein
MKTIVDKVRTKLRRHGMANAAHELALRALNCVLLLKVLRTVFVNRPDPAFLNCPERYIAALLSEDMIRRLAEDPANEMSSQFVDEALARGDECYAICDGETLAAYGWYAPGPTPIGLDDLAVHFSPDCVYMYKAFTAERYRGQRLHAIGVTLALRHYLAKGYRGLVSCVEATNFDSLKSCYRMGYAVVGSVWLVRIPGRYFTWTSPGCRRLDFRVEPAPGGGAAGLLLSKTKPSFAPSPAPGP